MGDGRNLINVLSSDVVIACRGALGTLSEIVLALKHDRTVILLDRDPHAELEPFVRKGLLLTARTPEEAVELAASHLGPRAATAEQSPDREGARGSEPRP